MKPLVFLTVLVASIASAGQAVQFKNAASDTLTIEECKADYALWDARDKHDDQTATQTYWFMKLSTGELIKLSHDAVVCWSLDTPHRVDLTNYELYFDDEILARAKRVLLRHNLEHEFLAETNE